MDLKVIARKNPLAVQAGKALKSAGFKDCPTHQWIDSARSGTRGAGKGPRMMSPRHFVSNPVLSRSILLLANPSRMWLCCACLGMLVTSSLVGCQTGGQQVALPTLRPRDTNQERAGFAQHDPYPDSTMGPETYGRPRDFQIQRTEPRRILEATVPSYSSVSPGAYPDPAFRGTSYPQTVRP